MIWLGVFGASVTFLFHSGELGWSDGRSMYEVTKSLVERGDVSITNGVVWKGADGRYYSSYGIGLSLIALVPYIVVKPFAALTRSPEAVLQAGVAAVIPLICGLLTMACYGLTRRLHVDMRTSVVLAIGTLIGTFLVVYSKIFCSEPLTTLCIILAIERAVAIAPTTSGLAIAAAALTRPQAFALAPLLLWRLKADGGWPALLKCTIPVSVGLLLAISYNVLRFRDPFNFGYSNPEFQQGFTTPFHEGAAGLLFHPEKSVFIFAPIVVLIPFGLKCLWSRHRTAFWLLSGNLVLTFAMSATWWAWGGGWTWGPRLLIPGLIPAIAAVGLWRHERSPRAAETMLALFVLGALVNIPAMLVGTGEQLADHPRPEFGPDPFRQLQLAAAEVLSPIEAFRGDEFPLWQVKALRMLDGTTGSILVAGMSMALAVAAAFACYQIHRSVDAVREETAQPAKDRR